MKLTDSQLVLLSAASQRTDGGILLPDNLKGAPATRTVRKLLDAGLIAEVPIEGRLPLWRRDEDETRFSLIITQAGLRAIGVEPNTAADVTDKRDHALAEKPSHSGRAVRGAKTAGRGAGHTVSASGADGRSVQPGSKTAQLIGLLQRPAGASIGEIVAELGWLPHTTRAALTGLRKRGFHIDRQKSADAPTTYRITGPSAAGTKPAPARARGSTRRGKK